MDEIMTCCYVQKVNQSLIELLMHLLTDVYITQYIVNDRYSYNDMTIGSNFSQTLESEYTKFQNMQTHTHIMHQSWNDFMYCTLQLKTILRKL